MSDLKNLGKVANKQAGRPGDPLHSEGLIEVQDPRDAHGAQGSGLAAGR